MTQERPRCRLLEARVRPRDRQAPPTRPRRPRAASIRGEPGPRHRQLAPFPQPSAAFGDVVRDWTGSRMHLVGKVGTLTLPPEVAGSYRREEAGVVEFVTTYCTKAIERMRLERILVYGPEGDCLGEVLPPAKKTPF